MGHHVTTPENAGPTAHHGAESPAAPAVEDSTVQDRAAAEVLAPHGSECFGCGPDNPAGIGMQVLREGDVVLTDIAFRRRHVGAPGVAHGGAVATACDDLFGFVLYVVREPAVTGSLEVSYRAPVVLDVPYRIRAWLERRDGRRLHMRAEGRDPEGTLCFHASAVFIVVPLAHFECYGSPQFQHVFGGGDTPAWASTDPTEPTT